MELRKLQIKDAPLMLEWMKDDTVVHYFKKIFEEKTLEDCIRFITEAQDEFENINMAIVDDHDEYMGTISLKNIRDNTAEVGIVLRSCAMGCGYASFGMDEIMKYGYHTRGIDTFFLCVDPINRRAVRFYEKQGYHKCHVPDHVFGYTDDEKNRYIWYQVKKEN